MIALACDHTGIELKQEIKKLLDEMGLTYKDFGTNEPVSCDYPIYGYRAAKAVAQGECDRGILICGTGIGIGIAASKVKGIRVCTCSDVYSAELSKRHNNSNILTMGARVVGVEYVPEAIADAKVNSELNGIENTVFYAGDMKAVLDDGFVAANGRPDVIILDPPRAGVDEPVIEVILRAAPERIVYVSCNPATQARDLQLMDAAYRVEAVQPVDMFPHTHHVENVVKLVRR